MSELSFEDLAMYIFSNPPKGPLSIQIQLTEADPEYVFQLLLNTLLEGLYILYGNIFDFTVMNDFVFDLLNSYMNSFGFEIEKSNSHNNKPYCKLGRIYGVDKKPYKFLITKEHFQNQQQRHYLHDFYIDTGEFLLNFRNI